MKSQEIFLNTLLDFSNIPSKRATDYHMASTSDQNKSAVQQQKRSQTDRLFEQSVASSVPMKAESELSNGNDKLLKSFNTLRDKLAHVSRENLMLKESLEATQQQLNDHRQRQQHYTNQIHSLSKRLTTAQQQSNQYKLRLNAIKQSATKQENKNNELEKTRFDTQKLISQNKRLKEELRMSMELSIQEKLQLEQEIQSLKLKEIHETRSNQQAQNQLYQKTSEFLRLENEYKKLKLMYDEEVFMKKVNNEGMILTKENQQLKLIVDDLESKLKKEKNKKYQLQTRLLELQEKVRLFGTRTDIYEGELETVMKKIKKVQKDHVQAKKQANSALNQKLSWEEKFYHTTIILEELISRVKRDLKGDAVQLAKTCEFRLNKLKNGDRLDLGDKTWNGEKNVQKQSSLKKKIQNSSSKKSRTQSQRKLIQSQNMNNNDEENNLNINPKINSKLVTFANSHSTDFRPSSQPTTQPEQYSKTVLKEKPHQPNVILSNSNINSSNMNLSQVKKRLFNDMQTQPRMFMGSLSSSKVSRNTQQMMGLPSGSMTPATLQMNLEAKIRKQRELMERKLREKILYHKIEDATSSPVRNKLRDQYFVVNGVDFGN